MVTPLNIIVWVLAHFIRIISSPWNSCRLSCSAVGNACEGPERTSRSVWGKDGRRGSMWLPWKLAPELDTHLGILTSAPCLRVADDQCIWNEVPHWAESSRGDFKAPSRFCAISCLRQEASLSCLHTGKKKYKTLMLRYWLCCRHLESTSTFQINMLWIMHNSAALWHCHCPLGYSG